MTTERFWIVGGDYSCLAFKALKSGEPQVMGPYETREQAQAAWRRISYATRGSATARYGIATEQIVLPKLI